MIIYTRNAMASFQPSSASWFPTRKAAQVAAYLINEAGGSINMLRLVKLIYLADRHNMERYDYPIIGDNFVSMPFGPVNSMTLNYINGLIDDRKDEWARFVAPRKSLTLKLARGITVDDLDELSEADIETLDATWKKFQAIVDQFELAEWTHRYCPEWHDPNGSSVPIEYHQIFKCLGKDDPFGLAASVMADRELAASFRA